jgi:hypothetical protein
MWDYLLHRLFGIGEGPNRVRIGGGVVINTTYAILGVCTAAGVIAWGLNAAPIFALGIITILAAVLVVYLLGTWRFADKHPDQAALGGSSWLRFRQMQLESKGNPEIAPLPPITDPLKPLPPSSILLLDAPDDE